MSWKYLSYPLNNLAFGYGNGDRLKLNFVRSMCCGDTSNNSEFSMPSHYGTHIDFPFHFSDSGKKSSDYFAADFVFEKVGIVELEATVQITDYLIRNSNLNIKNVNKEAEILIVKTGFCNKRFTHEYWEKGYGFHSETATYLKSHFPKLRCIAFDLISLNSYQQRPMGREAHKEFLLMQNILIIEDVDLREIDKNSVIKKLIVGVLQLENTDGAPCTILAEMDEKN